VASRRWWRLTVAAIACAVLLTGAHLWGLRAWISDYGEHRRQVRDAEQARTDRRLDVLAERVAALERARVADRLRIAELERSAGVSPAPTPSGVSPSPSVSRPAGPGRPVGPGRGRVAPTVPRTGGATRPAPSRSTARASPAPRPQPVPAPRPPPPPGGEGVPLLCLPLVGCIL
jgi:hypothetical protein